MIRSWAILRWFNRFHIFSYFKVDTCLGFRVVVWKLERFHWLIMGKQEKYGGGGG